MGHVDKSHALSLRNISTMKLNECTKVHQSSIRMITLLVWSNPYRYLRYNANIFYWKFYNHVKSAILTMDSAIHPYSLLYKVYSLDSRCGLLINMHIGKFNKLVLLFWLSCSVDYQCTFSECYVWILNV